MIKLERSNNNTRFAVLVDEKLLVSTTNLSHALEVYEHAKNNDLSFAERTFVPFSLQGAKILV
jgi:hypothetical protein